MGYGDSWLRHTGGLVAHNEVALHVFNELSRWDPRNVLVVGAGNGGALEIWREVLGEGSSVCGLDWDFRAGDLEGVLVGDMSNGWIREALRGLWFDVIVDSTGAYAASVWPFLRAGGRIVLEKFEAERMDALYIALLDDEESWLPIEEVMSVTVYQSCAVIEKRHPRVVPYLNVMSGSRDSVVSEQFLQSTGTKRVANPV